MLHILFLILKIIGIILLVILGITLVLVGVVLLVPIRYRMHTETTNGMKALKTELKANWFLHLISAHITYQEEELDWQVRVGWKTFQTNEEDVQIEDDGIGTNTEEENTYEEMTSQQEKAPHKKTSSGKVSYKKESRIEKIKCTIKEFYDKIKHIKEFLLEETHIQAFLRLKKEILFFIRKIKPDIIKGYFRFGLEEPYDTGRALAVLSVLYPFYGENFQVYPEFEREIIEGNVFFKGRIYFVHLLLVLGRLYYDKNVKTAYKKYMELKR